MKKLFSTLLSLFALQVATAQTLSPIVVKDGGVHYQRLAQIDTILKQYVDKNWLVGADHLKVKIKSPGHEHSE
jgi:hypothetical protein